MPNNWNDSNRGQGGNISHPGSLKENWITDRDAIDNNAVDWAENAGLYLKGSGLSTSSLRRFFGEIRRIQADFDTFGGDVPLLRAKLAYDANRKGKDGVQQFYDLVKGAIIAVGQDRAKFTNFVKLAEAIVAFHKAAGGSEK
jgi:CRISPR-associated protein Csm2